MVAIDRFGSVYPTVHLQDMLNLAAKPAAAATGLGNVVNGDTHRVTPEQFGLTNTPTLQFRTPGGGSVEVFGPLKTPGNDRFFNDPNPVVIQKRSRPVTYVQTINLSYFKPPAPPAPGPVIIKEVRPPQAPPPPPLFVRIQPPPPPEQAPLVIREAPPPLPPHVPTTHLTKLLPPMPVPPPSVQIRGAPDQAALEHTLNGLGLTAAL